MSAPASFRPAELRETAQSLMDGAPLSLMAAPINTLLFGLGVSARHRLVPFASNFERVEAICDHFLPGWGRRVMQCSLSTDAWLFPDWNHKERGDLLKKLYPPERWESRIDLDIRPPIGSAEALLAALLITLATIAEDEQEARTS